MKRNAKRVGEKKRKKTLCCVHYITKFLLYMPGGGLGGGGAVKSAVLCSFPTLEKLLCQPQLVLQRHCAFQDRFWSCWLLAEPMYTTEPMRQRSGRSDSRYGEFLPSQPARCTMGTQWWRFFFFFLHLHFMDGKTDSFSFLLFHLWMSLSLYLHQTLSFC